MMKRGWKLVCLERLCGHLKGCICACVMLMVLKKPREVYIKQSNIGVWKLGIKSELSSRQIMSIRDPTSQPKRLEELFILGVPC